MKPRYTFPILLIGLALLAGCAGGAPAPVTPAPTRPPTQAPARPTATREPGCSVVSKQPTPTPLADPLVPPVSPSDWSKGPSGAPVIILDYSDFQ